MKAILTQYCTPSGIGNCFSSQYKRGKTKTTKTFKPSSIMSNSTTDVDELTSQLADLNVWASNQQPQQPQQPQSTENESNKDQTPANRGTGAGGANTNRNGLAWEAKINPKNSDLFTIEDDIIKNKSSELTRVFKSQNKFVKYMKDKDEFRGNKTYNPDFAFIDDVNKKLYILEAKNQNNSGSVDEKITTSDFKKYAYKEMYPNYTLKYGYVLNNWFKNSRYNLVHAYNKINNVETLWGEDEDYFEKLNKWLFDT